MIVLQKTEGALADAAHIFKEVGCLKDDDEHEGIEIGWCALLHHEPSFCGTIR